MKHSSVVILDYGSQYTQLIARRVRELGVHSILLSGSAPLAEIQKHEPRAIILSGGPNSVYDKGAPTLPVGLMEFQAKTKLPLIGTCYGMQLLAHELGGKVEPAKSREYGRMKIKAEAGAKLLPGGKEFSVWMSHGDEVKALPPGFTSSAKSASGHHAAMEKADAGIFALQFHSEVTHTEGGIEILKKFLFQEAKITPDWTMESVIDQQIQAIQAAVGPMGHAICALSGGVDSAVAAALVHKALGNRLHCVFVDHGLMRYKERERVMEVFAKQLDLPVTCVDASQRFLSKLKGVTDPEQKRKIIGGLFIEIFDEEAARISSKPGFLVQGTLYPDVVESSSHATSFGGKTHSITIKTHHNVGGLPKDMKFKLIEPLRDLFKDEVRTMGKKLGVSPAFLSRHPFPGPGLAVRVIGEIQEESLRILREADEIFIESIREAGLYDQIWQAFAVFLPIRSVGVQGDGRTHDHVVALRAVTSSDGMTADWFAFAPEFLASVSSKICNKVRGVNRVVYDISSKPPATIEWE